MSGVNCAGVGNVDINVLSWGSKDGVEKNPAEIMNHELVKAQQDYQLIAQIATMFKTNRKFTKPEFKQLKQRSKTLAKQKAKLFWLKMC